MPIGARHLRMNAVKVIPESHVDHGLSPEQLAWLLDQNTNHTSFFIETRFLPPSLGTVECSLVGPAVGWGPVMEAEVKYVVRGNRKSASRVFINPPEKPQTRMVTIIAGPTEGHEGLVLYTAYGGPSAPREPGDPAISDWKGIVEARDFWAQHALIE
jgi:hypothetical protein